MPYHKRREPNEPERSIRETDPYIWTQRFAAAKANAELAEKLGNVIKAAALRKDEDQVAAWLLLKVLSGQPLPDVDGLGKRLQMQTEALSWSIDDILLTTAVARHDEQHLAVSGQERRAGVCWLTVLPRPSSIRRRYSAPAAGGPRWAGRNRPVGDAVSAIAPKAGILLLCGK